MSLLASWRGEVVMLCVCASKGGSSVGVTPRPKHLIYAWFYCDDISINALNVSREIIAQDWSRSRHDRNKVLEELKVVLNIMKS